MVASTMDCESMGKTSKDISTSQDNNNQVPGGDKLFKGWCPSRGRSQLKQYIPLKPKRWGYKFFILADQNGIVYNFDVYTGSIQPHPGFPDIGASGNIVLQLASAIPTNILHKLFFDNWFCSVDLQVLLEKEKIHSVGTVRQNRLAGCTFMDDGAHEGKRTGNTPREDDHSQWCEPMGHQVFDNRPVTLLSTFVAATPHHRSAKPSTAPRSGPRNGTIALSSICLDLTLVEAWLLYRRDCQSQIPENDQTPTVGLQNPSGLLLMHGEQGVQQKRPSQVVMGKKKRGRHSFVPPDPVRRDNTDHWPLQANDKGRCKMPGCKGIVRSRCSKCAVFLCFNPREEPASFDFHKG
ncbi:hypothetical protein SKAU_G00209640 [Synaphobranchus kaupii]|uniref:PiggyBac transposable element-derived protein domain-containing protein n=1 Tax=Synaphobranchus kaupii TaxID=118154 RepID=A0A9Q1F8U4_SYNKA|nr:hypothetical protein SKAU_G00209640 [Synaphobranchus kaupii]